MSKCFWKHFIYCLKYLQPRKYWPQYFSVQSWVRQSWEIWPKLSLHLEVLTPTATASKIYQYHVSCIIFCISEDYLLSLNNISRSGGRWVVGEGRYVGQTKVNSINIPAHSILFYSIQSLSFCSFHTFSSYISLIQYNFKSKYFWKNSFYNSIKMGKLPFK